MHIHAQQDILFFNWLYTLSYLHYLKTLWKFWNIAQTISGQKFYEMFTTLRVRTFISL